jgi:hypothetical protein
MSKIYFLTFNFGFDFQNIYTSKKVTVKFYNMHRSVFNVKLLVFNLNLRYVAIREVVS